MHVATTSKLKISLLAAAATAAACLTVEPAQAQDSAGGIEELVVTGSRGRPRTVQDSPVPIDVIPQTEIVASGYTDTSNVLQRVIPSYQVARNANADAATFVRPATLRGLPGDKTLVLVNSKRRHRSAAVSASGNGSQSADVAVIPSSALKNIEVLRDGAAALYGSDAIAGVINFILKDDAEGGSLTVRYGEYYKGDGEDISVSGNIGAPLPFFDNSFINASVEYSSAARTSRGTQFCNPTFCVAEYAAQNPVYAQLVNRMGRTVSRFGQPTSEALRGFVNSAINFDNESQLYAFGNYSISDTHADGTYRYPTAGQTTLDVPVRLQNGSIFKWQDEVFPAGYTLDYSAEITDYSLVFGYKGKLPLGSGLSYDLSARYGNDRMQYFTEQVNPSLGPVSPRDFMRAIYVSEDTAANADFGYEHEVAAFDGPLNIAFGAEFRTEGFSAKPGEPLAYTAGPFSGPDPFDFCTNESTIGARTLRPGAPQTAGINCANARDPVYNTLPTLTLTVSPSTAVGLSRDSYAGYLEVSADVTDKLFVDLAARFEDFSDFGSTANWKASGSYALTDDLRLRGSVGTGFRAPTPGQQAFTNVGGTVTDGVLSISGLFPASHPVSQFLGAQPLKPEKSFNLAAGVTATLPGGVNLSVDAYRIEVRDQYYATALVTVTPAIRAAMLAANVIGGDTITRVNFFQNAFDSTVSGLDVVATDRIEWENGQSTTLTASFNYNKYEIDKIKIGNLFDAEGIYDFENGLPQWKGVLSAFHTIGPFTASVRSTLWGPYKNMFSAADPRIQKFNPLAQFDAEVSYALNDSYTVTVGARNLFDKYPPRDRIGETTSTGAVYRQDSVVDWQGGFYFARFEARF
jgi:iron complex outermembrane receptor protein